MAQQRKTTTKKKPAASKPMAASRASAKPAAKKTTAKNAPKSAPISSPSDEKSGFADYFHAFTKSKFFKPVIIIFVILVLFGIDLLISFNNYDKFLKIWGIEMIIAAVILAIALALTSNKTDKKEVEDNAS